jgi:anti-sigma factor RsiW
LVDGGQYAKHAQRFNRHLAAIKKDRATAAKPTAQVQEFTNPLDAFGDLSQAAQ